MKISKSCCFPCSGIFRKLSYRKFACFSILLVFSWSQHVKAQDADFFINDSVYNPNRLAAVAIGTGSLYTASMFGLYQLWYKDSSLVSLHSFNDNAEWLQMDKIGHIGSAYYLGKMGIGLLSWTGLSRKKTIFYGGLMGAFFQTSIEFFDGMSPLWGFSWGDVAANAGGSALLISQELVWNEQRIQFKYSFHPTKYSTINTGLLGNSLVENIFKDYNGQTYWLSFNISDFIGHNKSFPNWLSISLGYGAEGMTGAFSNESYPQYKYKRYRQFYVAPDIDLARIKTKSKFLNTVFYTIGFIKFPLPGIEFQVPGKIRFLPLVF